MNKYKFKYPLHITGTFDQLIEIRVELYKLGYLDEENAYILDTDDQFICTQFYPHARNDFRGGLDYFQTGLLKTDTVVSANNRDLVLALAAMHDDDHFHEGEILRFIGHSGKSTDLYRLHLPKDGRRYPTLDFLFDDYRTNYQYDFAVAEMETLKEWRKATKEEIIEHFKVFTQQQTPKPEPMKTYIVDEDFIKEAYEAACPTWKAKLEQRFPELLKRYRLGDRFKYDGTEVPYILAQSEENRVILINLNTGNRYNDPVAVEDSESISKNEMQKIADGYLSRFRKES